MCGSPGRQNWSRQSSSLESETKKKTTILNHVQFTSTPGPLSAGLNPSRSDSPEQVVVFQTWHAGKNDHSLGLFMMGFLSALISCKYLPVKYQKCGRKTELRLNMITSFLFGQLENNASFVVMEH